MSSMNLPKNYNYLNVCENTVRTNFQNPEQVEKWVEELQECTKHSWYIRRTVTNRFIFKRVHHCCFKYKINNSSLPRNKALASRNNGCPAELIIEITRQQKARSKDSDHTLTNWPCLINFKNDHIHSPAVPIRRTVGEETKKEILGLFDRGHTVATAYSSYYLKIMEEFGDQFYMYLDDRQYFPKKYIFTNWKQINHKACSKQNEEQMIEQLEGNLKAYDDLLYKASHVGEHYTISLCTPIMQRAAREIIQQSSGILLMDTTTKWVIKKHKLHFFSIQSPAGGIPLACILTNSWKREVFDVAVKDLCTILPIKISPSVILTDNNSDERNTLRKYFPNSSLLLCTFQELKAVWKWLRQEKNQIKAEDRQLLYQMFRKILMSTSKEEMDDNLQEFYDSVEYPQYQVYVRSMVRNNVETWCQYFTQKYMIRRSNKYNYIEVMFKLYKHVATDKIMTYNLLQLTDFVVVTFERYYRQRLLDLAMNRLSNATISHLVPSGIDGLPDQITALGGMDYYVTSSTDPEDKYFVDMACNLCSCPQGYTDICIHQLAIVKNFNATEAWNVLSEESKLTLHKIATGLEPVEEILFPIVKEDCIRETSPTIKEEISIEENCIETNCDGLAVDSNNDEHLSIVSKWDDFIRQFDEDVRRNLQEDPVGFAPAIEQFMENYRKTAHNSSTLARGLQRSFRRFETCKLVQNSGIKKVKKVPARRTVWLSGKRRVHPGRQGER